MNYSYFLGIDLGKSSFDACVLSVEGSKVGHFHLANSQEGLLSLTEQLHASGISLSDVFICCEDMGIYTYDLCLYCNVNNLSLCLVCPLTLKKSVGIQRGKTDRTDARCIADYALLHHRNLSLYSLPDPVIARLRGWLLVRERLVKEHVANQNLLHTLSAMNKVCDMQEQITLLENRLCELHNELKMLEKSMSALVKSVACIAENFSLLTSVKGIGPVNAIVLICATRNFTKFTDHRKFACYCGVAPFEYSSGTSIHGKTRTSPLAQRRIKVYLTHAVLAAVVWDPQLKAYYKRKLEEGKHKGSVMNAVKAKILARCFAVVRRKTPFVILAA